MVRLGIEDAEDRVFDSLVATLRAEVHEHVVAEEKRVFPAVRRRLSPVRLRRLAYEMRVLEFELRIASSMLRPAVVSFLDEMLRSDQGQRVEEIGLPESGKERRIAELAPPDTDYVVLALRREGRWEFNPGAELRAKPGSTLIVMTTPAGRAKLERLVAA